MDKRGSGLTNVCMIPCRAGSQRLEKKNYRLFEGVNLVERMVIKAKRSESFDEIYINSDDEFFRGIADKNGIKFFHREKKLANSHATTETVVSNFLKSINCTNLFWLNTSSPLTTIEDIKLAKESFSGSVFDSMVTTYPLFNHALMQEKPINFEYDTPFARTQDLPSLSYFTYALMAWNSESFQEQESSGFKGLFQGKVLSIDLSKWTTFLLKNPEDLLICERLLKIAPE